MTKEEKETLLERIRSQLNKRRNGRQSADERDEEPVAAPRKIEAAQDTGDDSKPRWSEFQREAVAPLEELRKTDPVGIGKVIVADDRSRADKTPEQILRETESIEDRWAREKAERKAENLHRYENGPAAKLVHGEVDGQRWKRVKYEINEAKAREHYTAEYYHTLVTNDSERTGLSEDGGPLREDWKDFKQARIEEGIKDGFLRVDERRGVVPVYKDKDRPGEKLITGRIRKGGRGAGD